MATFKWLQDREHRHIFCWKEIISSSFQTITAKDAAQFMQKYADCARGPPLLAAGGVKLVDEDQKSVDLTDQVNFDWCSYLKCHLEGRAIVGHGVAKFELMFMEARRDSRTGQRRMDFVVHRVGDPTYPHVRLHPHLRSTSYTGSGHSLRREALPLFGNLQTDVWTEWNLYLKSRCDEQMEKEAQDLHQQRLAWEFVRGLSTSDSDSVVDLTCGDRFRWHRYTQSLCLLELEVGACKFALQGCVTSGFQDGWAGGRVRFRMPRE